jgi:hypothetical protein
MKVDNMDPYNLRYRNKGYRNKSQTDQSAEHHNRIHVDATTTSVSRLGSGSLTTAARLAPGNSERSTTIFHRSHQIDRMLDRERAQKLRR